MSEKAQRIQRGKPGQVRCEKAGRGLICPDCPHQPWHEPREEIPGQICTEESLCIDMGHVRCRAEYQEA